MSTESIRTSCPNCSVSIRVPATAAGRRARCPKCKGVLLIPALEPATLPEAATDSGFDDDVLSGLGQGSAVAVAPEVAQQRQAALAAAQARVTPVAAPAKAIAKSGPKFDFGPWLVAFAGCYLKRGVLPYFCILTLVFGGVAIFMGFRELKLRGRTKDEPQTITCEQLSRSGPGDNLFVTMKDFALLPYYVYEKDITRWKRAWVPAVSREELGRHLAAALNVPLDKLGTITKEQADEALDQMQPRDFDFHVIVSFPQADGPEYLERMYAEKTIQGVVFEDFVKLDAETRRLLQQGYPSVDVKNCHILVAGKEPIPAARAQLYIAGGIALALVSLGTAGFMASRSV